MPITLELNKAITLGSRKQQAFLTQRRRQTQKTYQNRSHPERTKQEKVIARDIPEADISEMPDGKFKTTNMKILAGIGENMEYIRDTTVAEIKEF